MLKSQTDRSPPGGAGFGWQENPSRTPLDTQRTRARVAAPLPDRARLGSGFRPVELVLDRLDGVRRNGSSWTAKCPSHPDRTPSLSVCEADDGRVLLKCFAGCSALDVVQSLQLKLADLFVKTYSDHLSKEDRRAQRRRLLDAHRAVAIAGVAFELELVLVACGQLRAGIALDDADIARLASACERIATAREVFRGR